MAGSCFNIRPLMPEAISCRSSLGSSSAVQMTIAVSGEFSRTSAINRKPSIPTLIYRTNPSPISGAHAE